MCVCSTVASPLTTVSLSAAQSPMVNPSSQEADAPPSDLWSEGQ